METFFRYTLALLISIVAGFQFVQVITRYVFETPVMGLEEVSIIPIMWLYILGSVNASREDTQIRANVLEIFLSTEKSRRLLMVVSESLSIIISVWLTWWAWDYFKYALRVWKETPTLYLPTFIYECSLFLGLLLMTLYVCWHLYKNLRVLFKGGASLSEPTGHDFPETTEVAEFQVLTEKQEGKSHD
jgi:TRAP-type C4-dicarboxylate transport system permease small subunit